MSAVLGPTRGVLSGAVPAADPEAAAWVRGPGDPVDRLALGGKAAALAALDEAGLPVPPWRVVTPAAHQASQAAAASTPAVGADRRATASPAVAAAIRAAAAALVDAAPVAGARWLAVRSSAVDEDGDAHSFAGQLESYLYVPLDDVVARVEDVWASATGARLLAYRRERGLDGPPSVPAVLLQPMIDADVAGVAFSADPVGGRRAHAVISAAYGLGTTIVGGEQDGDTYVVDRAGDVVARSVTRKRAAHRLAPRGGVHEVPVPADAQERSCLTPAEAAAVAALARAAERHAGRPQDVEWAIARGRLVLLQARPVTSLAALADPDGAPAVWDNSNITESYGGVTTPLTYTFARMVYEAVYAQFCRMVAVREAQIAAHAATFHCMIGLVRGRVYYNLTNWYRALALLPGYALNRGFMEQMMGVKEPLPPALAEALAAGTAPAAAGPPPAAARARAVWDVARCAAALLGAYRALPRDVPGLPRAARRGALAARPCRSRRCAPTSWSRTTATSSAACSSVGHAARQRLLRDAPLRHPRPAVPAVGGRRRRHAAERPRERGGGHRERQAGAPHLGHGRSGARGARARRGARHGHAGRNPRRAARAARRRPVVRGLPRRVRGALPGGAQARDAHARRRAAAALPGRRPPGGRAGAPA
jgi:hypothetical protein